jgi:hypothetical protein
MVCVAKEWENNQKVVVAMADQDSKMAKVIHESRWKVTHERDPNHTKRRKGYLRNRLFPTFWGNQSAAMVFFVRSSIRTAFSDIRSLGWHPNVFLHIIRGTRMDQQRAFSDWSTFADDTPAPRYDRAVSGFGND